LIEEVERRHHETGDAARWIDVQGASKDVRSLDAEDLFVPLGDEAIRLI